MKDKAKTVVLLDSHAIIHRAYHALPDFLSSKGEPTGALYGLANMLMKIVADLKPDYLIACYDLPGKTFRHVAYENYKAGRIKADDALIAQIKNSRQIFEAFNVPIYEAPGFEADDVLGTIVEKLKTKNIKVIIASGDMDTMQLVEGDKVQIFTLKKGITDTVLYNEDKVVERFGFKPVFLPDYKGLRGDPSDNIIGIKGIGEKTATELIKQFGSIEEMFKKLKVGSKKFKEIGLTDRIINLLKENEEEALFSKTLAKIRRDAPINFSLPEKTFWQNADPKKIEKVFAEFEFRSLFARLKTFFGSSGAQAINQTLGFTEEAAGEKVDKDELRETSIALWLLNSDIPYPKLEDILLYAGEEKFQKAKEKIFKELAGTNSLKVFEEIEKPIIKPVEEMGIHGVLIDQKYFTELSREYHAELDKKTKKIYELAGVEFNINSPKQLSEILFGKMGIKSTHKKSASGSLSTKISVLEELEENNPIIKEIMAYRELQKLLSTYIDVIPKMVGGDGRLHAQFLQNGSTTGRFSSQDPNLQNLPIKSELGRRIRSGFIASPGHKLSAFDYSQIELRIAAILSGDKNLTKIFSEKKDVHAGVASFVFGVPIEKVDSEMRRQAKVINFGIIYGMGVTALRKNLGGTREEAQKFYDNYFRQFSGVRDYLNSIKTSVMKTMYTETLFGRKRNFQNVNSKIPFLQNMALRTATNAPIQGTAADVIKLAIRYANEDLKKAKLDNSAHLILQVHDELIYEIKEEDVERANKIIHEAMEGVLARSFLKYKTPIPLEVHSASGYNLKEVK